MPAPDPADAGKLKPKVDSAPLVPESNPLIATMLTLDNQPVKATELVGFVGPSKQTGFFRLYFTLDLSTYVEIPPGSLIFAEKPDAADPSKATKIFVNSAVKLDVVQSVEASFLKGYIAKTHATREPEPQGSPATKIGGFHGPTVPVTALCRLRGLFEFADTPPQNIGTSGGTCSGCKDDDE